MMFSPLQEKAISRIRRLKKSDLIMRTSEIRFQAENLICDEREMNSILQDLGITIKTASLGKT